MGAVRVERIASASRAFTNMYMLEAGGEIGLVDACTGLGYYRLKRALGGRRPAWVFLTHWHFDHAGWLAQIVADYAPAVYCPAESAPFLTGQKSWRGSFFWQTAGSWWVKPLWGLSFLIWSSRPVACATAVEPGDTLTLGGECWEVVDLPGHTLGSAGLYHAGRGVLFSGDAVFRSRDGRLRETLPCLAEDRALAAKTFRRVQAMHLHAIYPGHYGCGAVRPER